MQELTYNEDGILCLSGNLMLGYYDDTNGDYEEVIYIVEDEKKALFDLIRKELSEYSLLIDIIFLEKILLTSIGKIDVTALEQKILDDLDGKWLF